MPGRLRAVRPAPGALRPAAALDTAETPRADLLRFLPPGGEICQKRSGFQQVSTAAPLPLHGGIIYRLNPVILPGGGGCGGGDRSLKHGDSDCGRNGSVFHLLCLCPSPQDATQELRPGSYQTPRSPSHPEGARGHPQPSWPPSAMLSQPPVMSPAREWLPSAHPCLHRFARRAISLR